MRTATHSTTMFGAMADSITSFNMPATGGATRGAVTISSGSDVDAPSLSADREGDAMHHDAAATPMNVEHGLEALGRIAALDPVALAAVSGSDQAASIARRVADMAQGLAALADQLVGQNAATTSGGLAEADCISFLESQFRIRRLRARHLTNLSLGEPAWDILLDLAVAQYWRRETSVTSLCIAADVPSTTALRWINSMTKEGLIVRRPCLRDGRRSFLAIAPATYQAMLALAADALRSMEKVRSRYQRSTA